MSTPKVYVLCGQNCKYESMTKEQILAAIVQAVNEGTIGNVDTGFITTIKTITGTPLSFFVGTQAEYDALTDDQKLNLFAIITNDTTKEGLLASLEEISTKLSTIEKNNQSFGEWKEKVMYGTTAVKKADSASVATKLANGKCICQVYFETSTTIASGGTWYIKVSATILLNNAIHNASSGFLGFKTAFIENVTKGVCVSATGLYGTDIVLGLWHDGTDMYIREISPNNVVKPNDQKISSVRDSDITVIYTNITE